MLTTRRPPTLTPTPSRLPSGRPPRRRSTQGSVAWPLVFLIPFVVVFAGFALYPLIYEIVIGARPANFATLWANPTYQKAIINTVIFVFFAVNIKMLLALALSGAMTSSHKWLRIAAVATVVPWMIPEVAAMMSIRWMLNSTSGLLNGILEAIGLQGQPWLDRPDLALMSVIAVHVWKLTPFWALTLLAARLAIPVSVYEAAAIDGAGKFRTFTGITWPLIAGVYISATILASIWAVGDFNSIYLVTGGGPADTTQVLATLGVQYGFRSGNPSMGATVVLTALPVLIPAVVFLIVRARRKGAIL